MIAHKKLTTNLWFTRLSFGQENEKNESCNLKNQKEATELGYRLCGQCMKIDHMFSKASKKRVE